MGINSLSVEFSMIRTVLLLLTIGLLLTACDRQKGTVESTANDSMNAKEPAKRGESIANENIDKTALLSAANSRCTQGFGQPEVVKALLVKGVDVNAQDSQQQTALMKAAGCGDLDTVKVLLEGGADVRPPREWDYSALTYALSPHAPGENNNEMIELLLKHGAKATSTDLAIAEQSHVNKTIYALLLKSRQIPVNIR